MENNGDKVSEKTVQKNVPKDEEMAVAADGGNDPIFRSVSRLPERPHPSVSNITEFDARTLPDNFFITVFGARRTGKTHSVSCMMEQIKDRFDFAYLFSSTAALHTGSDRNSAFPMIRDEAIFGGEKMNLDALDAIIERQLAVKKHNDQTKSKRDHKPNSTLIIIDDYVHDKSLRYSEKFLALPVLGRHYELSVIVLSQSYSSVGSAGLGPAVRQNSDLVITFLPRSFSDVERVSMSYLTKEKFENMWFVQSVCREKHRALCIDMQNPDEIDFENYCYTFKAPPKIPKYELGKVQWKLWKEENKRNKQARLEAMVNHEISSTASLGRQALLSTSFTMGEATGKPKKQPLTLFQAMQNKGMV